MSKKFMSAGEYTLACDPEKLINSMIQVYTYHFKKSAQADRDSNDPETNYDIGKDDGAMDAVGALLLQAIGGKELYKLWERVIIWASMPDED